MNDEVILARLDGGVAVLTLNRPDRLNALSLDMLHRSLAEVLGKVADDDLIGALVVTGAGRGFCAGADLQSGAFEIGDGLAAHMQHSHQAPLALYELPMPTIAAVNGAAAGAGLGLALACDVRVAAPGAKFVAPFSQMAMTPDFGLTWTLPRIVGVGNALSLMLDGTAIGSDEALRIGLVSAIHDDVVSEAIDMARRWAETSLAARLIKAAVRDAASGTLHDALFEFEPRAQATAMGSEQFQLRFASYRDRILGQSREHRGREGTR
jgi:enoyl-CoA hydratase/carnithine racemase